MDSLLRVRLSGTDYEFAIGAWTPGPDRVGGYDPAGPPYRDRVYVRRRGVQRWEPEPGMVGLRRALVRRLASQCQHQEVLYASPEVQDAISELEEADAKREDEEAQEREERAQAVREHAEAVAEADRKAKAMRCKRLRSIELRGSEDAWTVEVNAYAAGGLAHHRTIGATQGWTVTHLASGYSVTRLSGNKAEARRLHAALLEVGDWTVEMPGKDMQRAASEVLLAQRGS